MTSASFWSSSAVHTPLLTSFLEEELFLEDSIGFSFLDPSVMEAINFGLSVSEVQEKERSLSQRERETEFCEAWGAWAALLLM